VVGGLACYTQNHTLAQKIFQFQQISRKSVFDWGNSYRKWHPWRRGVCGHRGGHGHGR
jgi:hypothetical protein